jgi:hypothetical protein
LGAVAAAGPVCCAAGGRSGWVCGSSGGVGGHDGVAWDDEDRAEVWMRVDALRGASLVGHI